MYRDIGVRFAWHIGRGSGGDVEEARESSTSVSALSQALTWIGAGRGDDRARVEE